MGQQDVSLVLCERFSILNYQQSLGLRHQWLRIAFLNPRHLHRVQRHVVRDLYASRKNIERLGSLHRLLDNGGVCDTWFGLVSDMYGYHNLLHITSRFTCA